MNAGQLRRSKRFKTTADLDSMVNCNRIRCLDRSEKGDVVEEFGWRSRDRE